MTATSYGRSGASCGAHSSGRPEPPAIIGRIAGVGGRDVTHYDIAQMLEEGLSAAGGKKVETQRWHFHVNKTRNTVPLPQI